MPKQEFSEQVKEASQLLSQPDPWTCQSACVAMATGRTDILQIRKELEAEMGPGEMAGSPRVMGVVLERHFGNRYSFDDNACLSEVRYWIKAGCFIISHFWVSRSGHVFCLDGVSIDISNMSYKFSVKDPFGEFDFKNWSYGGSTSDCYDGFYSSHGIYAAGVAGTSSDHAFEIYRRGELDSMRKGMWIHRITP